MARIVWHPAFLQAIAVELADYQDVLSFESEHQLTAEPLKIDVLIIKKLKNVEIKKNIGRIFRQYNVVEYKSPSDRANIESYHKTQSYARLYAALNKVSIDEMSVSVVATRHPRKLLTFLKQKYAVKLAEPGIYLVDGDTCPTQVIVSEELSAADNVWINNLRNDLTIEQLELFANASDTDLPLDAYMYAVGEANIESMEAMMKQKKNGYMLSEKLDAFFTAQGEARGKAVTGRNMVLTALRTRFHWVPEDIEKSILAMSDPIALESLLVQAIQCETLDKFADVLR